jgi:DNA-binding transcriptional MerR regulator
MTDFTFYANPALTLVCTFPAAPTLFSLEASAGLTGVHSEMIRYYHRLGLIEARRSMWGDELMFDEAALGEVRRIEHYRRYLGVPRRALPLICELRRASERQHFELRFLRSI